MGIHIAIWTAYLSVSILQIYFERGTIPTFLIAIMLSNIIIFYINYLYLVPKLLLNKKLKIYVLFILIIIIVPTIIFDIFIERPQHLQLMNKINFINKNSPSFGRFRHMFPFLINTTIVIIGTSIRIYSEWIKNENNKKTIEIEKSHAELHFLKNQLNPHFLFNSLNSIYALTTKKSNDAPEAVITLSELMRYMLYQTDNEYVLLKDELEYIQNFLKLQRLRIANNENVTINIFGTITHQKIKPLLLISFIENAFKYGTDFKGNTEVKIEIHVKEHELHFSCTNLIGNRGKDYENSGIGLQNTQERLNLLYPKNHQLKVTETKEKFNINLILKL
ncbi:sensor histidine kinase [Lacinutrix undariae]